MEKRSIGFKALRGHRAVIYIFFEMLPGFLLGVFVFIFVLLLFQALRLSDFVLGHGVDLRVVLEIMGYIALSMLPVLLPMSLLFSVLMTYGRLSADSEMVAMKASGLSMGILMMPAVLLAVIVALVSVKTSYEIAPWGNSRFESIHKKIGSTKATFLVKEGTFSEGFFDLVVYANKVNEKTGEMEDLFLYDENAKPSLTVIAKKGKIIPDSLEPGRKALLILENGDIHRQTSTHVRIHFDKYEVELIDPTPFHEKEKTTASLTMDEIQLALQKTENNEDRKALLAEKYKRPAVAFLCLVFALLGVGLGTNTNRRGARVGGVTLAVGIIVAYWICYVFFEGMARGGKISPALALWTPNIVFGLVAFWSLRKNWSV